MDSDEGETVPVSEEASLVVTNVGAEEPAMLHAEFHTEAELPETVSLPAELDADADPEVVNLFEMAQAEVFGDVSIADTREDAELSVEHPSIQITKQIAETLELEEPQQEQVVALTEVLPEPVQSAVAEYIDTAEPEQVEKLEQLIVTIAEKADQLHEFAIEQSTDTEESQKVEAQIIMMYEELLSELHIELEEDQKVELITQIKAGDFKVFAQKYNAKKLYDPMHEHKKADLSFGAVQDTIYELLGKFVVGRSRSLVPYQTDAI